MTINWIRGFRRIGWVVTFPLAAFIVLAFYDKTKEFSPDDYEFEQIDSESIKWSPGTDVAIIPTFEEFKAAKKKARSSVVSKIKQASVSNYVIGNDYVIDLQKQGIALLTGEVPPDVVEHILSDYIAKHSIAESSPASWKTDAFAFSVHKRVNKLKLAGLIFGALACVVLLIHASISLLAWILRGFKGTSHIDVS